MTEKPRGDRENERMTGKEKNEGATEKMKWRQKKRKGNRKNEKATEKMKGGKKKNEMANNENNGQYKQT